MIFFMVVDDVIDFTHTTQEKIRQGDIDESLFAQIGKDGEVGREAFEKLYISTQRAVYSFVLSILKDEYASQDVVQETYLKIRSAAHLYQPQGKPLAWIFTIARNLSISYLRGNSKFVLSDDVIPDNDLRYSCVTDTTDRMVLQAALTILKEDERKIIFLHLVAGITHREIANSLDVPISTVLSKYSRALKKLKKNLIER